MVDPGFFKQVEVAYIKCPGDDLDRGVALAGGDGDEQVVALVRQGDHHTAGPFDAGSFQDFVTAMRFTEGEETTAQWLSDLDGLDPVAYANNNAIVAAVGRGEVEVGLVNHYYNFRALTEDPNVASVNTI